MTTKIKGWNKFQHFKDRRPPWIKLYRDLLDDVDWHELDPKAAKLLVMLWLIASENDGELPEPKNLAFRLRIPVNEVKSLIPKLSHWLVHDDNKMVSECYQHEIPETETETELEKEAEIDIGTRFEEIRKAYPKRAGGQRWPDAERAYNSRLAEGVPHEKILDGVCRYARFMEMTGKLGTEYVQQAATFLGRNAGYLEPWEPPAAVKDIRQLSAVERVRLANQNSGAKDERVVSTQRQIGGDLGFPVRNVRE